MKAVGAAQIVCMEVVRHQRKCAVRRHYQRNEGQEQSGRGSPRKKANGAAETAKASPAATLRSVFGSVHERFARKHSSVIVAAGRSRPTPLPVHTRASIPFF